MGNLAIRAFFSPIDGYGDRLKPEHFPVAARGSDIIASSGVIIASAREAELAMEIAARLNETEWRRQEEHWAF